MKTKIIHILCEGQTEQGFVKKSAMSIPPK